MLTFRRCLPSLPETMGQGVGSEYPGWRLKSTSHDVILRHLLKLPFGSCDILLVVHGQIGLMNDVLKNATWRYITMAEQELVSVGVADRVGVALLLV